MNIKNITAAYLMIGDEILSGRTEDKNLNFLAKELSLIGINLKEVRVVLDNEKKIIEAVNILRKEYNYLFTTGGIGPTHDDITSLSIAKAFGDKIIKNKEAEQILIDYYGVEHVNNARLKMAMLPSNAQLLENPVTSAPGFIIDNVIVMAGVPKIMQSMFYSAIKFLETGDKIYSKELKLYVTESVIAKRLEELQNNFPNISIGSYPFTGGTTIVFRSFDKSSVERCYQILYNEIN